MDGDGKRPSPFGFAEILGRLRLQTSFFFRRGRHDDGAEQPSTLAEPSRPAAEAPSEPRAGLASLAQRAGVWARLKLGRGPGVEEEPEPVVPVDDNTVPGSRPPFARLAGLVRRLRQETSLLVGGRTLTLSMENGIIRVVVFKGREVLAWGVADPADDSSAGDGAGSHSMEADEEVSRLQPLFEELQARRARLVTDLPLYTPLIRHLNLPEVDSKYLDSVVDSEISETIPFSRSEVDVKWQVVQEAEGGEDEEDYEEENMAQRVMAIAVRREVVDDHVERLREAGKGPLATYSQATALGLAAGIPRGMVVHLGPVQTAIVLVLEGRAKAVHRVVTAGGGGSVEDRAEALARAVEQMEGYDQTLTDGGDGGGLPLVVTGQVPADGSLERELRTLLQREVLAPAPEIDYPEDFPVAEFASNVGLGVYDRDRPKFWQLAARQAAASLNLLSERHIPTPVPFAAIATFLVLALFAVTAFNLTPRVSAVTEEADAAAATLIDLEEESAGYNIRKGVAKRLDREARQARQYTLAMESYLNVLSADIDSLEGWINSIEVIIFQTRPENVEVSDFKPSGDNFELTGTAPTLDDAIRYTTNIRESGLFINVRVRQVGLGGRALPSSGETTAGGILAGLGLGQPEPTPEPLAPTDVGQISFIINATARPMPEDEEGE